MWHISTSSGGVDVTFPVQSKCHNGYGMDSRQPWRCEMDMCPLPALCAQAVPSAEPCGGGRAQGSPGCPSLLLWESCESGQHYPGLLADCSQLFTQWERALAAHDMSALFSPGHCQVDGEAAGWGESIHNPDMRQRLSGYPHRQVWPVGLSPVSNTLSHLKRAIGTPALNTPACCCSPSGSLLASLKWAGCCFMGAGLCLDRWSRGWAP